MMQLIFFILKLTGWILLAVVCLLIFILLTALFLPLHYRVAGSSKGTLSSSEAAVGFHVLFHLVSGSVQYKDGELTWNVRAAWKKLGNRIEAEAVTDEAAGALEGTVETADAVLNQKAEKESGREMAADGAQRTETVQKADSGEETGRAEKPDAEKKASTEAKPAAEKKASTEAKPAAEKRTGTEAKPAAEKKTGTETKPAAEKKTGTETKPAAEEKAGTEDGPVTEKTGWAEKKKTAGKKKAESAPSRQAERSADGKEERSSQEQQEGPFEKAEAVFEKIKCTFLRICDKLNILLRKKEILMEFLANEAHQSAFFKGLRELKRLLFRMRPKKIGGNLRFGFEDPSLTGRLFGGISMLSPVIGGHAGFYPDFEHKVLDGDLSVEGSVRMLPAAAFVCRMLLDRNVRRTIRDIKNFSFDV